MKSLILVSGGDAPGINTTIAHYTSLAHGQGDSVLGARHGFAGALAGDLIPLSPAETVPWAGQAGAQLSTSREPVLRAPDAEESLCALLETHQIDNLLLFGGEGTLHHIPPLLAAWGIPYIGLPTTIDNDVPGTDQTLGFDSACNYAYQAIDGVLATAHALPGRIFTVETLGGDTGFLALAIAQGAGAHAVLLPEYAYEAPWLADRLTDAVERRGHALLVLSEGARGSRTLAAHIPQWTGFRVRDTRLGHAQRGGRPSHRDRTLAAQMARLAHAGFHDGVTGGIVVAQGDRIRLHEGALEVAPPRLPDRVLYNQINHTAL